MTVAGLVDIQNLRTTCCGCVGHRCEVRLIYVSGGASRALACGFVRLVPLAQELLIDRVLRPELVPQEAP